MDDSKSHRYVIDEDFFPKVTSDGEPHEVMTMVAAFSGLIAAVIVLIILIMLIGCKNPSRRYQESLQQTGHNKGNPNGIIIPIFDKNKIDKSPQLISVSTITTRSCYDNPACDVTNETNGIILTAINLPKIATVRC